jgi:hypothetical protein
VLERGGFRIERITYTNASILPITAAVRFGQRLRGFQESAAEITVPAAPVNAVLSGLLAVEAAALKVADMPAGSSLLCLAQKPVS